MKRKPIFSTISGLDVRNQAEVLHFNCRGFRLTYMEQSGHRLYSGKNGTELIKELLINNDADFVIILTSMSSARGFCIKQPPRLNPNLTSLCSLTFISISLAERYTRTNDAGHSGEE